MTYISLALSNKSETTQQLCEDYSCFCVPHHFRQGKIKWFLKAPECKSTAGEGEPFWFNLKCSTGPNLSLLFHITKTFFSFICRFYRPVCALGVYFVINAQHFIVFVTLPNIQLGWNLHQMLECLISLTHFSKLNLFMETFGIGFYFFNDTLLSHHALKM